MKDGVSDLERVVEQEMQLLGGLPAVTPSRACVERVAAAVVREAARVAGRGPRRFTRARLAISVAAAVFLAVGLTAVSRWPRAVRCADPEATLQEWAAAWDESNGRLARVLERRWAGSEYEPANEGAELEELFNDLEQAFDRLDAL
jgi:hypothetical protein